MRLKFWKRDKIQDEGWMWYKVCDSCGNKKLVNNQHICGECRK